MRGGKAVRADARVHDMLHRMSTLLAVALVIVGVTPTHASATYPEQAVKAIFLYRFAGYVAWPASTTSVPQFTIAVLGAEDVAEELSRFLPEHPIQGRPARVTAIHELSQLGNAQMLYIGPGVPGRVSALIDTLKNRPILIVTDQPGALEEGSMVNFVTVQQHVRFEISTAAAKRSGLQIGSGLLAVAERVKTGDLRGRTLCRPFDDTNPPGPPQVAAELNSLRYREGT